jgi:hypothetical protein
MAFVTLSDTSSKQTKPGMRWQSTKGRDCYSWQHGCATMKRHERDKLNRARWRSPPAAAFAEWQLCFGSLPRVKAFAGGSDQRAVPALEHAGDLFHSIKGCFLPARAAPRPRVQGRSGVASHDGVGSGPPWVFPWRRSRIASRRERYLSNDTRSLNMSVAVVVSRNSNAERRREPWGLIRFRANAGGPQCTN